MKKTIALDIDGTILVKGEIDKNVTSFFENDDVRKSNLMFLTGNSMKIASALVQKIAKNYPKYKNKKYYIATNNGASIYNKDGELMYSNPLDKKKVHKITKILRKKYKPCDILYTTLDDNYIEMSKDENRKKQIIMARDYQVKKGVMGIDITICEEKSSKIIKKIGEIYSINIICEDVEGVMADLSKFFGEEYLVYFDPVMNIVQVTISNKWQGLNNILAYEHKINAKSSYPKDASEIVYIGDGMNDIICMENCAISYARGENLEEKVQKSAKKVIICMEDVIKDIF